MCKYCETQNREYLGGMDYSDPHEGELGLYMSYDKICEQIRLQVYSLENKWAHHAFVDINYCPMCGRKLNV